MLVLLPPSEGKTRPRRGKPLDPDSLSFAAELGAGRERVIDALVALCLGPIELARAALELPNSMDDWIDADSRLGQSPTAFASKIYSGVLFASLDLPSLSGSQLRRANSRLAVCSALFGLVRPNDRIPAYRLSGSVSLPSIGRLSSVWRPVLAPLLANATDKGLVVDMRSGTYVALCPPPKPAAHRFVTVKIWQRGPGGQRTAVSHNNKAAKGRLARFLATAPGVPTRPNALVDLCRSAGWDASLAPLDQRQLDIVVDPI